MANKIVRDELNSRGVRHWELAHELGVSEQTLVRWLRFELYEDKQLDSSFCAVCQKCSFIDVK